MKSNNSEPDDARLGALLRESRATPHLPPRFEHNVWRRIEAAEAPATTTREPVWLETLVGLILRPRFAFATAAVLVIAGGLLGARGGADFARKDAQARYVTAVAPHALH